MEQRPTVGLAEPQTAEFRCLACALSFATLDELKVHYKQEFHRANLQRKISGLAPISAEEFKRRAEQQEPNEAQAQVEPKPGRMDKHGRKRAKEAKQKAKIEERARRHEAKMKKMQERAEAAGGPEAVAMTPEEEEQAEEAVLKERTEAAPKLDLNQCIFSEKRFDNFEGALNHMAKEYGFFIPDVEYLADPEGLVTYLRGKATIGYTCWYCEKAFGSWEAARKHMIDKSHCKLPYDGTHPEVEDFYMFGDDESRTDENTGQSGSTEEQSEDDDDDGAWEEVEDEEEVAAIEHQAQQLVLQPETAATRRAAGRAALAQSEPIVGDDVQELVLDDGRRLGHRSLARYYKQSVRPQELASHQLIDNLIASYRSMGHEIVARNKGRPALVLTKAERKEQKQIFTRKAHQYMNLGIKANKFHYNGVDDSGKARKV